MARQVSGVTGRIIPCCWTDCTRDGDDRYEAKVQEPARTLHFLFCSEPHLMFWVHSHVDMGNLPSGSKGGRFVGGWGGPKP